MLPTVAVLAFVRDVVNALGSIFVVEHPLRHVAMDASFRSLRFVDVAFVVGVAAISALGVVPGQPCLVVVLFATASTPNCYW